MAGSRASTNMAGSSSLRAEAILLNRSKTCCEESASAMPAVEHPMVAAMEGSSFHISCPVAGVDTDVAFGEIAGPEAWPRLCPCRGAELDLAVGGVEFFLRSASEKGAARPSRQTGTPCISISRLWRDRSRLRHMPAAQMMRPQLGSDPAMAVLTRGELAMERAMAAAASSLGAPFDFDGDQLARAFAIAGDLLGEGSRRRAVMASSTAGISLGSGLNAGGAVGEQEQRVVGGGVAIDGDAVVAAFRRRGRSMRRSRRRGCWRR